MPVDNSKHFKYLNILTKLAETTEEFGGTRIAACIVYKGDIISFGVNRNKSHPFQKQYGTNADAIYLHAETDAIQRAIRELTEEEFKRSTLYVARVKKDKPRRGKFVWGMSKPCSGCSRAIANFGIKNVFYTCEKDEFECL